MARQMPEDLGFVWRSFSVMFARSEWATPVG